MIPLTSLQKFNWSLVIALALTALSYSVGFGAGWITTLNWIEVAAVFTSYSCTYLCVVQSRWNYIIGTVSLFLYAWMFFSTGLYASMALQFYLLPVMLYGWFRWGTDARTLAVTSVLNDKWYWIAAYVFIMLAAYGGVYNINMFLAGNMAMLDTGIFVASVLAQFLMDNKKLENWVVWFVVNVISIIVYFKAGLFLIAFQYVAFLLNTAYGFYKWNQDAKRPMINA